MVMSVIVGIFPDNLFKPMGNADMLPVIVIAIFSGAGILAAGEKVQKMGELVNFTPYGVFRLLANVVGVNGPAVVGSAGGRRRRRALRPVQSYIYIILGIIIYVI